MIALRPRDQNIWDPRPLPHETEDETKTNYCETETETETKKVVSKPRWSRDRTGTVEHLVRTTELNMADANFIVITNVEGCALTGTADIN